MIANETIIQFGTGTLIVGCKKINGPPEQWCIVIMPKIGQPAAVGETQKAEDCGDENRIILTFTTEKQMLIVKAAFVNKTYEEIKAAWDKKSDDNINIIWKEQKTND